MADEFNAAITALQKNLEELEKKAAEIKGTINKLSALAGKPQPYSEAELSTFGSSVAIRPDQFFGKGISTAVKEFVRMRGQACTAQVILEGLKTGGFEFPKDWGEKHYLKNLAISLSKNSADFVYVKSSNAYGLWEFYPEKARERKKKAKGEASNGGTQTEELVEGASNDKNKK